MAFGDPAPPLPLAAPPSPPSPPDDAVVATAYACNVCQKRFEKRKHSFPAKPACGPARPRPDHNPASPAHTACPGLPYPATLIRPNPPYPPPQVQL